MLSQSPHNHRPPPDPEVGMTPDIDQLAVMHGRAVFHAAYRVLGDAGLAEDVQQGVFMRLIEHPPRQAVEHWAAYLCSMATRAAIDELRRRRRWQRLAELFRLGVESTEPRPTEVFDQADRAHRLRAAIGLLPKRQAECFALRFFGGLSLDAIADELDVTNNVVSVSLNRATRSLRRRIEALGSAQLPEQNENRNQE